MEPAASAYLPTIEAASAAGLPLHAARPTEQLRLAALVVRARIVRRDGWSEIDALDPVQYRALEKNVLPSEGQPGAVYHVIGQTIEDTLHWVSCRIDHYVDKLVELKETWVPAALRHAAPGFGWRFETAIESLVADTSPPEALRCLDLTPKTAGGAYRTAQTTRQPDFHGFDFGDTIAEAEKAVNALLLRGTVVSADIRAWAWPFVWLRYESQPQCILFFDPQQKLHLFTAAS